MIKMNENMLKQIIINTIKGEEHLGDNLKRLCVDYIEQQENKQLKEVIEEVREEVENSSLEVNTREYGTLTVCNSDNLLQILDKVKENKWEK